MNFITILEIKLFSRFVERSKISKEDIFARTSTSVVRYSGPETSFQDQPAIGYTVSLLPDLTAFLYTVQSTLSIARL